MRNFTRDTRTQHTHLTKYGGINIQTVQLKQLKKPSNEQTERMCSNITASHAVEGYCTVQQLTRRMEVPSVQ